MRIKINKKKSVLISALLLIIGIMAIVLRPKRKHIPNTGSDQTRGVRNNNPLNLRKTNTGWKHKVEGTDTEFETFSSMMWGVRASLRNMRTHYYRGVNTIQKMISIWAPPSENNTNAYVAFIVKETGREKYKGFEWNQDNIYPIVKAMCQIESKYDLDVNTFKDAWKNI